MKRMLRLVSVAVFIVWPLVCAGAGAALDVYAKRVSSLVDPAKLATLGKRGANQRVQKHVAVLAEAKSAGCGICRGGTRGLAGLDERRGGEEHGGSDGAELDYRGPIGVWMPLGWRR